MVGDLSETVRWFSNGAYTRNFHSGLVSVQVSRPMLEGTIARRLRAMPNVTSWKITMRLSCSRRRPAQERRCGSPA